MTQKYVPKEELSDMQIARKFCRDTKPKKIQGNMRLIYAIRRI